MTDIILDIIQIKGAKSKVFSKDMILNSNQWFSKCLRKHFKFTPLPHVSIRKHFVTPSPLKHAYVIYGPPLVLIILLLKMQTWLWFQIINMSIQIMYFPENRTHCSKCNESLNSNSQYMIGN